MTVTPVEQRRGIWLKRDDLFSVAGASGGKARACWRLAQGATGLVTASARSSPQLGIVARCAAALGVPCRVHVPAGAATPEMDEARRLGATLVAHRAGYNTVIVARAREDAAARGWCEIPFGMECAAAVALTAEQTANIPAGVNRIVMPVGSGLSLCGVLSGLANTGRRCPVLGIRVGADPAGRIARWAPPHSNLEIVRAALPYDKPAPVTTLAGVALDPIYEAKCLPYLQPGDLLWIVGIRGDLRHVGA